VEELKTHIENQFEDGMTWENWKYDGWHLRTEKVFSLHKPTTIVGRG